jgi:hypothetical protein
VKANGLQNVFLRVACPYVQLSPMTLRNASPVRRFTWPNSAPDVPVECIQVSDASHVAAVYISIK